MKNFTKKIISALLALCIVISIVSVGIRFNVFDSLFPKANAATYTMSSSEYYKSNVYALYDYALTWDEARAACESLGGHLAVITSAEEQEIITSLVSASTDTTITGYWLGANDIESEGSWKWVTGEPFDYTYWGTGEPSVTNSSGISENCLEQYKSTAKWNDARENVESRGFICEFEGYYIPKVVSTYNDHIYMVFDEPRAWTTAKTYCENMGGHLVTINDSGEQAMLNNLVSGLFKGMYWIGCSDAETEGTWEWVTGESFSSYTNWAKNKPNGTSTSTEDYGQMYATDYSSTAPLGSWNDDINCRKLDSEYPYYRIANVGFICEIETDSFEPIASGYYGYNYYEVYGVNQTWSAANEYAKNKGGHLVTIKSREEELFFENLCNSVTTDKNVYWMGAKRDLNNEKFGWITGEEFGYTDWNEGAPNNEALCEFYLMYRDGFWGDYTNRGLGYSGAGFVIEYESYHVNLTLIDDDGSVIKECSVQGNSPITALSEITKEGFKTKWYTDQTYLSAWNSNDIILHDLVLYAKYVPKYTITFDYNGSIGNISQKTVTYGEKYGLFPKPTREGYSFGGWFTNDGKEITYSTIVNQTSDITLYAKWIPNEYVVDFNLNGGTAGNTNNSYDSVAVTYGFEYGALPTPLKEGYRFSGWYLSDGTTKIASDSIVQTASDHTLTANWTESQISSVAIGSLPNKTEYGLGESLKTDGLTLLVTFDNGETAQITEGYTCEPLKFESVGSYAIIVSYEGFETQFEVTVSNGLPTQVSVYSLPYKTEYLVGDTLNTNGLTLLAEYVDDSEEIITSGYECSVYEFNKAGTQKITVTYGECETTFNVTIVNGEPIGVTIQTLPNKLRYTVGEELDITGLVLKVEYPNSVYKSVTDGFETTCNLNSIGTKNVNVTYTENGVTYPTSFTVEVIDADIATVWASNAFANAGEAVSIPVTIMSNQGFMGFSIVLEYDETVLTPVSVTAGEMLSGGTINDSVGGSMSNGKLMVTYYTDENICVDGTLFTVNFAVNESASPGKYSLGISYIQKDTYNENYEDVKLTCTGGVVSVSNAVEDSKLNFCSDSVIVNAGEVLSFPIYVGNANELTDFTLTLNYNNSIFGFKEIQSEFVDEVIDNGDGTITFICNNASINTDNLLVLIADFKVEEYVEAQETIDISCSSATVSGTTVEANCTNAEITIINPYADEPAIIYTDEKVLVSDEYVNVPVYINNNHGIMGFQLNVSYDSAVIEPFSVTKGTLISIGSFDNNIGNITDKIKIIWNNTENVTDNGLLFTLCFKVLTDEKLTSVPVEFSYSQPDTYNESWEDVELDISFSTIPVMYEYTAHFVADGVVVSTQKFTIETENLVEPEIPQKAGYIASWSYYEIKEEDLIINAKYYLPETIMLAKRTLKVDDTTRLLPSSNFKATSKAWSSSNTSVAVVDNYGNVTAVGEGKCTIKVICYGEDSFGNEIKASTKTQIVVNDKTETKDLKGKFREAFDEFFEVKLHDFLENLKKFMIVLFRYAY